MKANNIYSDFLFRVWLFIKKASIAIVSGVPTQNLYSTKSSESRLYMRDEESDAGSEKHYHQPISKPAVEQQTMTKESKKKKGYHS